MTNENKTPMPEKKFVSGGISATVWKNTAEKDGKEFEYHTVSVERNYRDEKEEWHKTSSMRVNDLPKIALVSQKAYEYLTLNDVDVNAKKEDKENKEEE